MKKFPLLLLKRTLCVLLLSATSLVRADNWFMSASAGGTTGAYKDSQFRDRMWEAGARISGEYLDTGGLGFGYTKSKVYMKNGAVATDQNAAFLSGKLNFRPDGVAGRITTRLDRHSVNNNDATGNTDNVGVWAPQVSYLKSDGTFYADLGYAGSRYQNQLDVQQWTPTIGFGFNGGADWIQLRSYQIGHLNPARASGLTSSSALDAKWTHSFGSKSQAIPTSVTVGALLGQRIYAVDMDVQSVSNLADIQRGGVSVALEWLVAPKTKVLLFGGQNRFREVKATDTTVRNDYRLNVGYAGVTMDW